jgi:hypothetical protein
MSASLLDVNILETPELETVPAGEYQMRLIKAQVAKTKDKGEGTRYGLNLVCAFAALDGKKSIRNWLPLESKPEATADQKQMDSLNLKALLISTGLNDQTPLVNALFQAKEAGAPADVPELIGTEPWAVVSEPAEDPVYGLQNRITRFMVSK